MLLDTVSSAVLFDPYFEAWRWLYGGTEPQPNAQFALRVLMSFLACVPLLLAAMRSARGPILAWILVPAAFAIALNVAPSEPIWRAWIIAKVQFPWRFVALVDFATAAAVVAATAVDRMGKRLLGVGIVAAAVPASMLAVSVQYPPEPRYDIGFGAIEYLSPEMANTLERRLGQPRLEYFDKYDVLDAMQSISVEFQFINGTPNLSGRRARSLTVLPVHGSNVLSLPVQYWVFWQAQTASGKPLEIRANPQSGTIDIIAPAGGFEAEPVIVSLPFHPSEWAGGVVSLLALFALLASFRAWPAGVDPVAPRETAEH